MKYISNISFISFGTCSFSSDIKGFI
jgi:hypothetical protein